MGDTPSADRWPGDGGAPGPVMPSQLACGMRWRRAFPGEERQLGVLRRWLKSLFPECPARADVLSVATELASNAIRHTASGHCGLFAVEVAWYPTTVRVAVADSGGPSEPRVIGDPGGEHGRGLLLVQGLSVHMGTCGDHRGRLVWADVPWNGTNAADPETAPDAYEAAIREGQAVLARRFTGVPAWFGRSTLTWWALPDSRGLVSARSARELGALLHRRLAGESRGVKVPPTAGHAGSAVVIHRQRDAGGRCRTGG